MARRKSQQCGLDLARAEREFARWRQTRAFGTRIPQQLWRSAVKLAAVHGVNRTAKALSLDYYSLKERVDNQAANSAGTYRTDSGATFVELAPPMLATPQECVIELENIAGWKMRVSFKGGAAIDPIAVAREFWSAE